MNTLKNFNFKNKKAIIRVDFNVPLNQEFQVTDATRIQAAKSTITAILSQGGSCVLMSHLGRPNGFQKAFSLQHIVPAVEEVLGCNVKFVADCVGAKAEEAVANLAAGEVLLLENLRFYEEEKKGDVAFAEKLSKLGDIYVNDAFGTAHRAHASTTIIAQFFEQNKCFGNLLAREIESIDKVLNNSEKPVLAILGGAKVSSKITVIENILDKVDHLIIGGGMSFTFVKALGGKIGNSICEDDKMELALEILKQAKAKGVEVHIPVDVIAADDFSNDANTQTLDINEIPDGWEGVDAGPKSRANFDAVVNTCKTILWNGPLGVFEMEAFAGGTIALGHSIDKATKNGAFSLVGGGDSVAAVKQFGFAEKVSYVSTGGGAMLEMLEGKTLPG
ncbi:MAG: phosphoglycerate kinase, partial [Polaribacter sp.]|nr:phosphoglycerate kinase [Polaribacter sp.]